MSGRDAIEKDIHLVDQDGNTHKGAEAIFKSAERYPRPRMLTGLARTPPIEALASVLYGLVAANRRFLLGPASRVLWLKAAVILAFCIGLLMSSRLWIGPRSYPLTPVSSVLPAIDGF